MRVNENKNLSIKPRLQRKQVLFIRFLLGALLGSIGLHIFEKKKGNKPFNYTFKKFECEYLLLMRVSKFQANHKENETNYN